MAGEKGNTWSASLLKLLFQAVAVANIADNAATAPLTALFVSLHTADPTAAGTQNSSEAAYTGYARVSVARTTGGWSITAETISNVGAVTFPASTSGPEVETWFGIGVAASGATELLYAGPLTASLTVNNGITPSFGAGALTIVEG